MWIVRWTLVAVIILVILGLALQNNELVEIRFFTWHSGELPIYFVFYFAFAAGMLVFLLISAYFQVQRQLELHRSQKEIKRLQDEVDSLKAKIPESSSNIEKTPLQDKEDSPT